MKAKINHIPVLFIALLVLCLVVATPALAVYTYYVDADNGLDNNDGKTSATAWQTLHYAIPLLQDGDTLNVAAGTYSVTNGEADDALTITQDNIIIQGTAGAVLDGEAICDSLWDSAFEINASNVTIRKLKITNFTCDGVGENILITSGSNNRIESCDISNSASGILFSSGSGSGNVVEKCTIYNHDAYGINIQGGSPEIFRNTIYDNTNGIYMDYGDDLIIRPKVINNLIYNTGSGNQNMQQGIWVYSYGVGTIAAQIFHNTIDGGGSKGIYISLTEPDLAETIDVKYNIITNSNIGIEETVVTASILVADYNNVFGNNLYNYNGVTPGSQDISMDPLFVDAAGLDFHLVTTSPLLNGIRADAGDTVADDLDGIARPMGLGREMGCYEIEATQALWVHNVGDSHRMVMIPDINNDGSDDLVVHVNATGDNTSSTVYVVSGANGADILWTYDLSTLQRGLAILGDHDEDGIQDILVMVGTSDRDNNMGDDAMYLLSGSIDAAQRVIWGPIGHEGTSSPLGCGLYQPVIVPDVDGDGINDIFANVSVRLACYNSDAGLLFSGADGSRIWYFTDGNLWDVYGRTATPDLDGDTIPDIVVSGASSASSGGVQAWAGGGVSASQIWPALTTENITNPAVVGDINSDGVVDIGVGRFHIGTCPTTPDPRLYILDGQSGTVLWQQGFDRTPSSIENLGDVTGDGIEDVVIGTNLNNDCGGSDSSVYALDGAPASGTRVIWSYPLTDQNSYVKVVADADSDGKKDVLVSGEENRLVLLSGADGSVLAQETFPNGSSTVQPGEFNNAAGSDLLTNSGNSIYALSFEPTGTPGSDPPAKPALVSPADEAVIAESDDVILTSGPFSDSDAGSTHAKTEWSVVRWDTGGSVYQSASAIDLTQHTVVDSLEPGLKYTWQVRYEDNTALTSPWSDEFTFKVGTSVSEGLPAVSAGTGQVDFGMISIVHWPDNPSPAMVFDIRYDPRYYRIGTYDPVLGRYVEYGSDLVVEPGRAYWMLAREGLTVNFNGIPVSKVVPIEVCLHHNGSTTSPDGWNMIAPPNAANYLWGGVMVGRWISDNDPGNVAPVTMSDSAAADLIDQHIWQWEAGAYKTYLPENNFELEMYKGYWVKAKMSDVYLVFPTEAQVAGLSTPKNTLLAVQGKTVQWLQALLPSAREAIADNDQPPMPMGGFEDNVDPVFEGCFVESTGTLGKRRKVEGEKDWSMARTTEAGGQNHK